MSKEAIKEYNLGENNRALQGYSPVSYLDKGKAEKGSEEYAVEYEGVEYLLTSPEQVEKFNAAPHKYTPAFGGWCAYGMGAKEQKLPIDPFNFKIVDDQLFLFYKDQKLDALKLWNEADEKALSRNAARVWHSISGE